jgi:hypothetical protein
MKFNALIAPSCLISAFLYLSAPANAADYDSSITLNQDKNGKITLLEATNVKYADILQILAVLSKKKIQVVSAPETPLNVHYEGKTPQQALFAILLFVYKQTKSTIK